MVSPTAAEEKNFAGIEGIECIPNTTRYETAILIDVVDGDSIKVIVMGNQPRYDTLASTRQSMTASSVTRRLRPHKPIGAC